MMMLSRALALVKWEVIEAWKRLKVKSGGKTMARAKIWNKSRIIIIIIKTVHK